MMSWATSAEKCMRRGVGATHRKGAPGALASCTSRSCIMFVARSGGKAGDRPPSDQFCNPSVWRR